MVPHRNHNAAANPPYRVDSLVFVPNTGYVTSHDDRRGPLFEYQATIHESGLYGGQRVCSGEVAAANSSDTASGGCWEEEDVVGHRFPSERLGIDSRYRFNELISTIGSGSCAPDQIAAS